jgi:hypothetical protein
MVQQLIPYHVVLSLEIDMELAANNMYMIQF